MTIISELKTILESISSPSPTVHIAAWNEVNELLDSITDDTCIIFPDNDGIFKIDFNSMTEQPNMMIGFAALNNTNHDESNTGQENLLIADSIKANVRLFLSNYNRSAKFKSLKGEVPYIVYRGGKVDAPVQIITILFKCEPLFDYSC